MSQYLCSFGVSVTLLTIVMTTPVRADDDTCMLGTTCLSVNDDGTLATGPGPNIAQCSGDFPDFIAPLSMLENSKERFRLSQSYPKTIPAMDAPWLAIKFDSNQEEGTKYLYALRNYAFDGMIDADFEPAKNKVRQWFHMPLMNFGPGRREPLHGLTSERPVTGPELGLKPGITIHNYAIGFYNAVGAYTIGQVWKSGTSPDLKKSQFEDGAMAFKILFTDAKPDDFSVSDILAGAPSWEIATKSGRTTVRLLQMDVAAADSHSPTGWVFGTFAYDKDAADSSAWRKLRAVGLSWGNDFGFTPGDSVAGRLLKETFISAEIPSYSKIHLGWAGRANGPVDNPVSGCLSCHGTAQFPVGAQITFSSAALGNKCDTDEKKMQWFRNFTGDVPFGEIDTSTCMLQSSSAGLIALDFSLQMQVAVQSLLQYHDSNPCNLTAKLETVPMTADEQNAPRVQR
ncbi:hypothetical protein NKI19_30435 [Mesorhizobium sp. M0751]|uniref:hypothetical protein n=1 Tax=unclassified Mesorhizobium TaxID=325217 RepID=UPI00333A8F0A